MTTVHRSRLMRTFAAAFGLALLLAGPAGAQDTQVDEPPADTDDAGEIPGGLDFGDAVVVDEDGTVRWNLDADNEIAEADPSAPTPIPESGISGTGELERDTVPPSEAPAAENSGNEDRTPSTPLDSSNAAGSGNRTAMILGIAGGVVALAAGLVFLIRSRRLKADDTPIEDVMAPFAPMPEAAAPESVEDSAASYDGASDAGAYDVGGAAYAQYTDPSYETGTETITESGGSARSRIEQLKASMSEIADKTLVDTGQDRLVASKLEAAGSQMRPGEWLLMAVGGTIGALFIASFLLGWLIGGFAAALTAIGFWMVLTSAQAKRQKAFAEALPETLQLVSGSLRGGLSMMQAIHTVADEADEPTASEFQRIVTETRLGRDLALSFRDLAGRMDSKDFEWVVTAIEIHRDVGGDLAGILDRVGNTIRARNRVRGQVKALSAEGRVSGLVLFLLPPVMVCAIAMLNRGYLNEMLNETEGQIMLVASGVMLVVGGIWLKRLARFVY